MTDNPWLKIMPGLNTPVSEPVADAPLKKSGPVAKYPLGAMTLGSTIQIPLATVPGQNFKRFRVFLSNKGWYLDMKFQSELIDETIHVQRIK